MVSPSNPEDILDFLRLVGIEAHIQSAGNSANLIGIPTKQFEERRDWIERWFTPMVQAGDTTYLRERPRGTGDTK